jgi:hypothetical protein
MRNVQGLRFGYLAAHDFCVCVRVCLCVNECAMYRDCVFFTWLIMVSEDCIPWNLQAHTEGTGGP